MAATLVDTLIRFPRSGYKPRRSVKIALTCGEETNGAFNGMEWLAANKRDLIDAEFALNEGGGGTSDGKGKVVEQAMQSGKNLRDLPPRNPQSGRPQLSPPPGQRHLSAGAMRWSASKRMSSRWR